MIGVSRETVTRLLGELRDKGIIQLKGSNLLIRNKAALQGMIHS
jgi:CRP-like cAMP-binding protein